MVSIPAPAQTLLGTDTVVHVWTNNPDGSPQISVIWVIAQGDQIKFCTDKNTQKAKNLARDPNIVMSIEDTERNSRGQQRHLVLYGTASIEPGPDPGFMDSLAVKYVGLKRHPLSLRDSPDSVVITVDVDRIDGIGPWID